jgi:putative transposase
MARPLRIEFADAVYHVTSRGMERRGIVVDDVDRDRWRVFAYAVMNNHYHLLVQTPERNLSAGMHTLNGGYVRYFNVRHGRSGPLLQGRYKVVLVEDGGHWDELSRYIHLNPVRARLVGKPEEWLWSSYRGYYRRSWRVRWVDYERVLTEFGGDKAGGVRRYRAFMEAGLGRKLDSPVAKAVHGVVLGSEDFVKRVQKLLAGRPATTEVPELGQLKPRPEFAEVIEVVCRQFKADPSRWKPGTRCDDPARALAAYVARQTTGLSSLKIAQALGYRNISSISVAYRRTEESLASKEMARAIQHIFGSLDASIS